MLKVVSAFVVVSCLVFSYAIALPDPFRPDFTYAHDAFACNYVGTICKERTAILPISWRRYVGDL